MVAKYLWPDLKLTPCGDRTDREGIDAFLNGDTVQIKADRTISFSNRLYHEIYEKTKGKSTQTWRHSPQKATVYIFVADTFAILTTVDSLAVAEQGKTLVALKDRDFKHSVTSIGFFVYPDELDICERKEIPKHYQKMPRLFEGGV